MNVILLIVTGVSLTLAGFMSAVAWQMTRSERRRSDARVAALASAIYEDAEDAPAANLFADRRSPAMGGYGVAALVGACVIALLGGLAMSMSGRSADASRADSGSRSAGRQPSGAGLQPGVPASAPLELLALEHERDGDALVIRGLLRNPSDAAERDGLSAVVLLLGAGGDVLATARAAVPAVRLEPGATTPFVVNVTGVADIDRFRLSFRTDARVEPHVDRRRS
jgi:hypothetical protein